MSNKNMFALLNSDSDEEAPKPQKASAPAQAPKAEAKKERKPRKNDRADRPPRAERDDRPYDGSDKVRNPADDRREGGKGKREGGKGKGKGSRGDSGREYPRRSQTGRGRENPRGGGGKYNWGKDTDGQNTSSAEPTVEGEEAAGDAEAPAVEAPVVVEEEEPTIGFDEWEKVQAEKMASLNSLNTYKERKVVDDEPAGETIAAEKVEDDYLCMFHDSNRNKKDFGRKQAREGYKQADQVLNLKFVDEESGPSSKGKGKGERKGKGGDRRGKGGRDMSGGGNKSNIDLSNSAAFPSLG